MSLLTCTGVTLRMGGRTLLDGADLAVDPGRRIGLVGRNGAGKSTLLKAIAGDITVDGEGRPKSHAAVLRDVVAQAELADRLGVDFFGVGEHHRPDFAISAPEVLLGAIATRTERIRLGTAVTILSTDDPVRVYQRFSTLDAMCRVLECQPGDLLEWVDDGADASD